MTVLGARTPRRTTELAVPSSRSPVPVLQQHLRRHHLLLDWPASRWQPRDERLIGEGASTAEVCVARDTGAGAVRHRPAG